MIETIKSDPYARSLGVEWIEIKEGYAQLNVIITDDMLNFLGYLHGGVVFSLADIAFSAASNMDHSPSLALNVSGNFLRSAKTGDTVKAIAERIHTTKRTGLYKMEVVLNDELVAQFNGTVFRKS